MELKNVCNFQENKSASCTREEDIVYCGDTKCSADNGVRNLKICDYWFFQDIPLESGKCFSNKSYISKCPDIGKTMFV